MHLKSRITDLIIYQNARVVNVLLHEISHNCKISYITFLKGVNLPHPHLKIQGSN